MTFKVPSLNIKNIKSYDSHSQLSDRSVQGEPKTTPREESKTDRVHTNVLTKPPEPVEIPQTKQGRTRAFSISDQSSPRNETTDSPRTPRKKLFGIFPMPSPRNEKKESPTPKTEISSTPPKKLFSGLHIHSLRTQISKALSDGFSEYFGKLSESQINKKDKAASIQKLLSSIESVTAKFKLTPDESNSIFGTVLHEMTTQQLNQIRYVLSSFLDFGAQTSLGEMPSELKKLYAQLDELVFIELQTRTYCTLDEEHISKPPKHTLQLFENEDLCLVAKLKPSIDRILNLIAQKSLFQAEPIFMDALLDFLSNPCYMQEETSFLRNCITYIDSSEKLKYRENLGPLRHVANFIEDKKLDSLIYARLKLIVNSQSNNKLYELDHLTQDDLDELIQIDKSLVTIKSYELDALTLDDLIQVKNLKEANKKDDLDDLIKNFDDLSLEKKEAKLQFDKIVKDSDNPFNITNNEREEIRRIVADPSLLKGSFPWLFSTLLKEMYVNHMALSNNDVRSFWNSPQFYEACMNLHLPIFKFTSYHIDTRIALINENKHVK